MAARTSLFEPGPIEQGSFTILDERKIAEDSYYLATADLRYSANYAFDKSLFTQLDAISLDEDGLEKLDEGVLRKQFSSRESAIDLLCQPLAQDVMLILWRNSRFLSAEGKAAAGFEVTVGLCEKPVSKGEIVNIVCRSLGETEPSDIKRIDRRVGRYLAAMDTFGLICITQIRCNLLEISITNHLDEVMRACLAEVGEIFASQLSGEVDDEA